MFFILSFFLLCSRAAFCAPVPLFDIRLSPPLLQVSSLNSKGVLLAVQASESGPAPSRVISIDRRGRVNVIEDLTETKELTVPAGRLWIAGGQAQPGADAPSRKLPVVGTRVYLSESGETYTAVFQTKGAYYELRHKDAAGGLLFMTGPREALGLNCVTVSGDGSRVLVSDKSPPGSARPGQRLYLYDRDGRLELDEDMGDDPTGWLDVAGGFMARDGSWFMAGRGAPGHPASSIVLLDGEGGLVWEKNFFNAQSLIQETGGLVAVKGGSPSFINFIDKDGSLKILERSGYGFDFWINDARGRAYLIMFKPFDVEKSGIPKAVKEMFPGAKVVAVDIESLVPEGYSQPVVEIAPDGKAFILSCEEVLGGQEKTEFTLYGDDLKPLWHDSFFSGDVSARFADGSRGFALRFGEPVNRLIYYEAK